MGSLQQKSSTTQGASRGAILASDGFPLSVASAGWVVWADPGKVERPKEIAEKLAPLTLEKEVAVEEESTESAQVAMDEQKEKHEKERLEKEKNRLFDLMTRKGAWVPLKHKIDTNTKRKIQDLDIAGINFDPEERRTYPEASMAAHILGFVGKDEAGNDKGYFGLEGKYDTALSGVGGEKAYERDALGNPILGGLSRKVEALDGVSLKTHIDRTIQYLAEKHLKLGIEKYGASSGSITIMRPSDGAILALSALPNYSPSAFYQYKGELYINPVISQTFEPGSIFKVIVMAAALDSGTVKLEDRCGQCSGPVKIGQYTIGTWDGKYYPQTSPAEIIKHSDNTGMVWTAQRLGADKLYDYLASFGIGALSGIDLQGETATSLRKKGKWGDIDLATTSFGQGIAVTPIQMVRAVSAIANKGRLPTPQVISKVVGNDWEEEVRPQISKEIISPKTAQQITDMMISAVQKGEAQWAAPKGFLVAGKTGTAQIPIAGHYDPKKTNASFIGFAPAENPRFVMMVTLKEPASSPWAAETAAPLWFNVARDLFIYLGVQPSNND